MSFNALPQNAFLFVNNPLPVRDDAFWRCGYVRVEQVREQLFMKQAAFSG
jgi:hypothetical protein